MSSLARGRARREDVRPQRDAQRLRVDEVLLGVIEAWLEQERALVAKRLAGRPRRCPPGAYGEARALEALALRAARIEVLPRVREPPVVVGAERSVEGESAARGPEAVDQRRLLGERRLAVRALAGAGRDERRAHAGIGQDGVVERERLLAPLLRRPLEEGAGVIVRRPCCLGLECGGRSRVPLRRDHAAAPAPGLPAAASAGRSTCLPPDAADEARRFPVSRTGRAPRAAA